mmetsp:Transcript_32324/g.67981  ORF Transcript_32324/g.67981 Transcript_32324/m.67981 type:complete len:231 (+) Transcript_32324:3524-4216(+)
MHSPNQLLFPFSSSNILTLFVSHGSFELLLSCRSHNVVELSRFTGQGMFWNPTKFFSSLMLLCLLSPHTAMIFPSMSKPELSYVRNWKGTLSWAEFSFEYPIGLERSLQLSKESARWSTFAFASSLANLKWALGLYRAIFEDSGVGNSSSFALASFMQDVLFLIAISTADQPFSSISKIASKISASISPGSSSESISSSSCSSSFCPSFSSSPPSPSSLASSLRSFILFF